MVEYVAVGDDFVTVIEALPFADPDTTSAVALLLSV